MATAFEPEQAQAKRSSQFVKRGEKGIQILAPVTGYRRRKDESKKETDSNTQRVLVGFRPVYVFEQTEGADLPELNHTMSPRCGRKA